MWTGVLRTDTCSKNHKISEIYQGCEGVLRQSYYGEAPHRDLSRTLNLDSNYKILAPAAAAFDCMNWRFEDQIYSIQRQNWPWLSGPSFVALLSRPRRAHSLLAPHFSIQSQPLRIAMLAWNSESGGWDEKLVHPIFRSLNWNDWLPFDVLRC
jgi:hypothetical protein